MAPFQSMSWPDVHLLSISWWASQQYLLNTAIVTGALLLVMVFSVKQMKSGCRSRMPPGPRPWPIIGNLGLLSEFAHHDFQKLAKKYGPLFHLRLGSKDAVVVSSPKIAEEILKTQDVAFASRRIISQFDIMWYGGQTVGTAPYGPFWRHIRKVFTLGLLTHTRIQQFQKVRNEEVVSAICEMIRGSKGGQPIRLSLELKHLAMNNVTRMMMNKTFYGPNASATDKSDIRAAKVTLGELFALNGVSNLGDYIPILKPFDLQGLEKRMRAVARENDNFLQRIVDEHRRAILDSEDPEKNVKDLVDVLLTHPSGPTDKPLTEVQIKGMIMAVLSAGTDTTSVTVDWAMAELLKHPEILKKAQAELDSVVGRDRLVEEVDLPKLQYLHCIVKETFRMHPVGPLLIPHQCIEAREVAGYHIPLNTEVFVNVYAIQRDPDVWEHPLEFSPDRFLTTSIDVHGQDFELLPFGAGRRICPGKNLGLLMVNYMLATLLHACDWSLPPGMSPEDVDLGEASGSAVPKKIPLEAIATPRLPIQIIRAHK